MIKSELNKECIKHGSCKECKNIENGNHMENMVVPSLLMIWRQID